MLQRRLLTLAVVIFILSSCSKDDPAPQTTPSTKVLTEIEKVICGSSSKTWKFVAINKDGANVIRTCAINDDWIFRYSGILEIKNNGVSCDGQDAFQEHMWEISSDEKNIIIGGSTFLIIKMQSTEMQLQEKVLGDPVFVFQR